MQSRLECAGGLEPGVNKNALWVGGALIVVVAIAAALLYLTKKLTLHGAVINPPLAAASIELTATNGQPFSLIRLRGHLVVLYFGYTNCPDECPLTMAHLKLALELLGADASRVRVVMITTDPGRDTPAAMKEFLAKFNASFVGLVGTADQLAPVWKDYGVTVENGGETHSYFVYVIDTAGNIRETFLPDSLPADEAADLKLLLAE
jgi:protein SCO1/2